MAEPYEQPTKRAKAIMGTDEAWENRELGADERYVQVVDEETEEAIDRAAVTDRIEELRRWLPEALADKTDPLPADPEDVEFLLSRIDEMQNDLERTREFMEQSEAPFYQGMLLLNKY